MSQTELNKKFIEEMLGQKKRLEDYPDKVGPQLVMHEPMVLPFGGTYKGLADFARFYPQVRNFYDFASFELTGVYAEGDTVFSTARVIVAGADRLMHIAEQFRFAVDKLVEVRVYICDEPASLGR